MWAVRRGFGVEGGESVVPSRSNADELSVAAVQFAVGPSKQENLSRAAELVARAAAGGARLVVLPEKFNGLGSPDVLRACAEPLESGESVAAMRRWATEYGIFLVGGSITEQHEDGRLTNTSVVLGPDGECLAVYRKIHLFDITVGDEVYRESDLEDPGEDIVVVDVDGWSVGLSICYDLRFPELYRILMLRGAELIVVPAAFTLLTGRDHWEVLLRARAIENQCYVVAANECGQRADGKRTYGRSMVVDPWGTMIAQASDGDAVVPSTLQHARVDAVRSSLPALQHRRSASYAWPEPTVA
jgi:predicted amidohydrolase